MRWGPVPRSMRARTTLAAALAVAAALGVAAVALVFLVHRAALRDTASGARDELRSVLLLTRSAHPSVLPAGHSTTLAQVVSAQGVVVASSRPDRRPMADLRPAATPVETVRARLPGLSDPGPFLVVAQAASRPRGSAAYVATSLATVDDATGATARAVVLGGLGFVALVAVLVWVLIGRALRPVESIRAEVADISEGALARRVPEPAGDDEIGRLARTMNAMLGRLDEAVGRQRRFVADSSHELRSPLASMRSHLDIAEAHPGLTPSPELLAALRHEVDRLGGVLADLSFLARADESSLRSRHELLDLDDVVLGEVARIPPGDVVVDASGVSAAQVDGNPAQLARAVRNLLDNAVRHARRRVVVTLAETDGEVVGKGGRRGRRVVRVVVADDGPGIPASQRELVFERFTRLQAARERESGGAGLGLSIVRQITALHGGTVGVADSRVGAQLVLELPAADAVRPTGPSQADQAK